MQSQTKIWYSSRAFIFIRTQFKTTHRVQQLGCPTSINFKTSHGNTLPLQIYKILLSD